MSEHSAWMFWRHKWQAKAIYTRLQPVFKVDKSETFPDVGVPKTDVLYVCACGKAKSLQLHGTWKLEDVKP